MQLPTAGDFLLSRRTTRAERCTPKTTEADLAAAEYNLKKLLKSISAKAEPGVGVMTPGLALKSAFLWFFWLYLRPITLQN
jgi:hypothetical protein